MSAQLPLLLLFGLLGSGVLAQTTDYDQIVLPLDQKARDFSEYLVQLAWQNNPESGIAQNSLLNARSSAKNTKKEWMRDIQASFNLNEANLRSPDSTSNIFFPRYNIGLNLNLFHILSQKEKSNISKRDIETAQQKINQSKLELRAATLLQYEKLKLAREIRKVRVLAEQEMYANYILIQQLYKTDEKTLEEYTNASNIYYAAQEARIKADADLRMAQFALEALIGLKWEQVNHPEKDK